MSDLLIQLLYDLLSWQATMLMEACCLIIFFLRLLHNHQFTPSRKEFWMSYESIIIVLAITVILLFYYKYR